MNSVDSKKVMIVAGPSYVGESRRSRSSSGTPIYCSRSPSVRSYQSSNTSHQSPNSKLSRHQLVFIWDVKTDKPLRQIGVVRTADKVAISPDASQMAVVENLSIKIINVSTGQPIDRQTTPSYDSTSSYDSTQPIWSPTGNNQTLASARRTRKFGTAQNIVDLAYSPDSSKVVAILEGAGTSTYDEMTLSMWCTRSGNLVGTISFKLPKLNSAAVSFAADGRDILICGYDSDRHNYGPGQTRIGTPGWDSPWRPRRENTILLHFSVISTHLENYMNRPLTFHPSQTPHTIQYSHYTSGAIDDIDYASHMDADGWILNTKGEREIWTPWANYELLSSCKPPPEGQTQYRTLEVRDPGKKTVVLIYVITFEHYRSTPLPVLPGSHGN